MARRTLMHRWDIYAGDPGDRQDYVGQVDATSKANAVMLGRKQWGTAPHGPGRRLIRQTISASKAYTIGSVLNSGKRAGAARRKANAVKAFLKKMNPARKVPDAVKVTRLKGGGFTVKPVRNLGRLRRIVRRTVRRVTRRRARR